MQHGFEPIQVHLYMDFFNKYYSISWPVVGWTHRGGTVGMEGCLQTWTWLWGSSQMWVSWPWMPRHDYYNHSITYTMCLIIANALIEVKRKPMRTQKGALTLTSEIVKTLKRRVLRVWRNRVRVHRMEKEKSRKKGHLVQGQEPCKSTVYLGKKEKFLASVCRGEARWWSRGERMRVHN